MTKCNEENERIKRAYLHHLSAARGLSEASIGVAAAAINRLEQTTGHRSFKKFHCEQAIAFRRKMDDATRARDGEPLSKATIHQTLNSLRSFMLWLAEQPGYRKRIRYSDADYFRLSEKDTRIAKARHSRPVPTPEQIETLLQRMPEASANADRKFQAVGIARKQWRNADAARKIFREAFEAVGLHGFNPHSFRHALAMFVEQHCRSPEEFKAWSQNLGHENVLTTLCSYGTVPPHRQAEIIKSLTKGGAEKSDTEIIASRVAELLREKM